jgi:hypothetical protein
VTPNQDFRPSVIVEIAEFDDWMGTLRSTVKNSPPCAFPYRAVMHTPLSLSTRVGSQHSAALRAVVRLGEVDSIEASRESSIHVEYTLLSSSTFICI